MWAEVRKWAKEQGFSVRKEKDNSINGATYYWSKIDDDSINGKSQSVSKLAIDLYNHITNNKWIDHQENFKEIESLTAFNKISYYGY